MDEKKSELEFDAVHHKYNVMDEEDQKLVERITKKIHKYERKANDLKILLERLNINEPHSPKTPERESDPEDQTTPLRGGQQSEKSDDLSVLRRIMEEDLRDYTQQEKIEIVSPGLKIGTNSTNIYRNIIDGKRKDSPAHSCIENYMKWKEKTGTRTNPRPFSLEKKY